MILLRSASTLPSDLLQETAQSQNVLAIHFKDTLPYIDCEITGWWKSPTALIFRVWHEARKEKLVIKVLCPYKDTRYSFETLEKRQRCLLEGLRRNRVFTPELYIGLAPLYGVDLEQKTLRIGEVMSAPKKRFLDDTAEYVLVMNAQDENARLDRILARGERAGLLPLAEYVVTIHNRCLFGLSTEESRCWGNYDHLMHKLEHNLELLDFLIGRCNESDWEDHEELASRAINLKQTFWAIARRGCYRHYFQQRIVEGHIKLCHGDIKSQHIWLASDGSNDGVWSFKILDAVDFNPMYNHIDVLSDFALLIADIEARTKDYDLVDEMIDCYLRQTVQENEIARSVLAYYIVEKAIVGAAISILYDDEPQLGRAFLKVAERRLDILA